MGDKLFVDTSAWLKYFLKGEARHEDVVAFLAEELERGRVLYTSNDVVDETVTRLLYDEGFYRAEKFYGLIEESVEVWVLV